MPRYAVTFSIDRKILPTGPYDRTEEIDADTPLAAIQHIQERWQHFFAWEAGVTLTLKGVNQSVEGSDWKASLTAALEAVTAERDALRAAMPDVQQIIDLRAAVGLTGAGLRDWNLSLLVGSAIRHLKEDAAILAAVRKAVRE